MTRPWLILTLLVLPWVAVAGEESAEPAREMTLSQVVGYALEDSPDLRSAGEAVDRLEGGERAARAALFPQVDLFGDLAHSRLDHAFPPGTSPSTVRFDDTILSGGVELKYLAWDFGQARAELAAARERVGAAKSALERRRQEILFQAATLYLQTLTYRELRAAAESSRKSLAALLVQTHTLVDAGRAVPADALKVATRLAQVESDLATLDAGQRISLSRLAEAMGLLGPAPRLVETTAEGAGPASSGAEEELVREALGRRADLASQTKEVQAAALQARASERSAWPRVELRGGAYGYASDDPSAGSPTGHRPDHTEGDWAVGLRVTFPVFDGGRRAGQLQSAGAQRAAAQAAKDRLRLSIRREVLTALAEVDSAKARVRALGQAVTQAEEVLRVERLKYEAGKSTINFVLDAEASLLTSQSLLRQAMRSVDVAALSLELSIGRIGPEAVARR